MTFEHFFRLQDNDADTKKVNETQINGIGKKNAYHIVLHARTWLLISIGVIQTTVLNTERAFSPFFEQINTIRFVYLSVFIYTFLSTCQANDTYTVVAQGKLDQKCSARGGRTQ